MKEKFLHGCYSICLAAGFLICLPYFFYKAVTGKRSMGNLQHRFGILPYHLKNSINPDPKIWIHAASVGEVEAVLPLIETLANEYKNHRIIISTFTDTGYLTARHKAVSAFDVIQVPLDFTMIIRHVIQQIKPCMLLIVETELWPSLIREAYDCQIPIAIVNGRMSKKSFEKYSIIKGFLKDVLRKINLFLMESEQSSQFIRELGAENSKIVVTGNLKFDKTYTPKNIVACRKLLDSIGWDTSMQIITAGSTHHGEEEILIGAYKNIRTRHEQCRMVIVPRHIERSDSILNSAKNQGLRALKKSDCMQRNQISSDLIDPDCIVIDEIGVLIDFFALATLCFVGGTLDNTGGHNLLEPAAQGKPVIFGSNIANFKTAADHLIRSKGGIKVQNKEELIDHFQRLLSSTNEREKMGANALKVIEKNKGAVAKTMNIINDQMPIGTINQNSETVQISNSTDAAQINEKQSVNSHVCSVATPIYKSIVHLRNKTFDHHLRTAYRSKFPVISIGNISVGGTGKTPFVMMVAKMLETKDFSPIVLSRGYGGNRGRYPELVPEDGHFSEWGDEPLLIAKKLRIPVVVCRKRVKSAKWVEHNFDFACMLLDDGFQHRQLHRVIDIVLIDARENLTHQKLLPAGKLREPLTRLSRADAIIFSHSSETLPAHDDVECVKEINPKAKIFFGCHIFNGFLNAEFNSLNKIPKPGDPVGSITAIENPKRFISLIEDQDLRIIWATRYRDHFAFQNRDWQYALDRMEALGGKWLLTTGKDAVKNIPMEYEKSQKIRILDISFKLSNSSEFQSWLITTLRKVHA